MSRHEEDGTIWKDSVVPSENHRVKVCFGTCNTSVYITRILELRLIISAPATILEQYAKVLYPLYARNFHGRRGIVALRFRLRH